MIHTGIHSVDSVGTADVSDPRFVLSLLATFGGLPIDSVECHPLLYARIAWPSEKDVQRRAQIAQHHHAAAADGNSARRARAGQELLDVPTKAPLVKLDVLRGSRRGPAGRGGTAQC